jgi:tetratricopeptide (TPR) repeat protein
MLHFLNTVGRKCENVACGMRGRQVGWQVESCEACQRPLVPVRRLDWRRAGLAAGIAIILVAGLSWLTHIYLQQRAAEREALRLSQATARFQNELRGATASDLDAILRSVQAELQLSEDQKQQVLKASSKLIDSLPRALTADVEQRLELLIRDLYGDGRISANDRSALDQFTREHRLAPQAVQRFEGKLTDRLDDSYRSISQGKALAGQGKYEEARLALDRATQTDPGNAIAWANLGALHVLLGQPLEARTCYEKALSRDPDNWLAHYNLGVLAARSGDRESAFLHLQQALSTLPAHASQERREVIDGLLREPDLEDLRRDPRFTNLLGGGGAQGSAS